LEASRAGLGDRPTDCTEGVPEARNGLRDTFLIKKGKYMQEMVILREGIFAYNKNMHNREFPITKGLDEKKSGGV